MLLALLHFKTVIISSIIRPMHVGFVVNKVALEQVILPLLRLSPTSITPSMFHIHISFIYRLYISLANDSVLK
jgi:hypothetical protein